MRLVPVRSRIIALYGVLGAANVLAWVWAAAAFHGDAVLLGTALLAYTFGLRHAVDADHIAAIDNVTRKLMQEGQRPVAVGFFFSLGHAAVVALAVAAVALTAGALQDRFAAFRAVGGLIGTGVSVSFLFAMAVVNLFVLASVYRRFRAMRSGSGLAVAGLDDDLDRRGILARLCRPLFRLIRRSWHMFPLGFLFGLGFETATEIALLGIAADAARQQPIGSIMVFPALFAAGMTLIDSTDSVLMVGAYGWAFVKPIRKLYYNLIITAVSVVVALVVGGIEALGLVADRLSLDSPFWAYVALLNRDFGRLGYLIIAIFIASWALSALVYRLKGYDDIEAPNEAAAAPAQDSRR
ncbi:MAG TPA: HoxN/HupN/NixA family nickel/cobalt transporter [Stellaceae bacterium]|nr:HoxN/HupN/NixA family nickel/cobalt transporter [Stellaceae bacterium]